MVGKRTLTTIERFMRSFTKHEGDACWIWNLKPDAYGYGQMGIRGAEGEMTTRKAHRVSYEIFCGKIPKNISVLHKCDNPICINPAHLFLGTKTDNMNDKKNKKRHHFGNKHPMAKLSEDDVQVIIGLEAGGITHQKIADKFDVCRQNISKICARNSWTHMENNNARH